MPRPATGKTPVRNLRVKPDIWEPALDHAQEDGTTITNVITRFLERYNAMTPTERRIAAGLEPEPAEQSQPSAARTFPPITQEILGLPRKHVEHLAARVESYKGETWVDDVLRWYRGEEPKWRPYRIVQHGLDQEVIGEWDLYPQEP